MSSTPRGFRSGELLAQRTTESLNEPLRGTTIFGLYEDGRSPLDCLLADVETAGCMVFFYVRRNRFRIGVLAALAARQNSPAQHVAAGLAWLRQNATRTVRMTELAREMHMIPNTENRRAKS